MYNNLLFAVKRRILDEAENAFEKHPAYAEKVKVYHKFPYEERVQYGLVLNNTSASQIRMSADNYLAEYKSHTRVVTLDNKPGSSIEWVRENQFGLTLYQENEDVSSQVGPTQRMFQTKKPIMAGRNNTISANNIGQIKVTLDGVKGLAEFVDGEKGIVLLRNAPAAGTVVKISYYYKTISDPALYVIDFISNNKFLIAPIYLIDEELVIESTTGTETEVSLANSNIDLGSEVLYYRSKNDTSKNGNPIILIRDVDYTIDYALGKITFLYPTLPPQTPLKNYEFYADYRWQPTGYYNGPYEFRPYQELHEVIDGVVISIGRKAQAGDRQGVYVTKEREIQAKVYGGHYLTSLDVSVIAKDPIQMEEMADHIVTYLWSDRKSDLEFEGITLESVEPSGESEEAFIDLTGDLYYITSVSINVMTEWQKFAPYLFEIKRFTSDTEFYPGAKNYSVTQGNALIESFEADTREVIKYPVIGYERVT